MAHGKKLKSCQPPDTHLIKQPSSPYHLLHCFVMLNYFFLINPAQTLCLYIRAVQGQSSGGSQRPLAMPLKKNKTKKKQWRSSFLFVWGLFRWGAGGYAHIRCRGLVCSNCCFSSRTFFAESFLCSMLLQKQATALFCFFFFNVFFLFPKKKKKKCLFA